MLRGGRDFLNAHKNIECFKVYWFLGILRRFFVSAFLCFFVSKFSRLKNSCSVFDGYGSHITNMPFHVFGKHVDPILPHVHVELLIDTRPIFKISNSCSLEDIDLVFKIFKNY